ncbi:hypothetical protein AB1K89_14535 [Sporosarcina sp. 179-K 8C2 HS]|uniref:hypothetical protein n=1 Tax=Sporosarcina sp. 179-K 8C2 HS TaxID=3142387 RepID=UPI0039A1C277
MFKKAIPFVLVSGLVLTACGNYGNNGNNGNNVPGNNETPMENLDNTTPRVNNGAGPDMDGIDNGRNNGVNNGIINDDRDRLNGDMNGDNTIAPNDNIITDDNVTTPNDTNRNRNNNR